MFRSLSKPCTVKKDDDDDDEEQSSCDVRNSVESVWTGLEVSDAAGGF